MCDPRLPGPRRQVRPRHLHRRPRAAPASAPPSSRTSSAAKPPATSSPAASRPPPPSPAAAALPSSPSSARSAASTGLRLDARPPPDPDPRPHRRRPPVRRTTPSRRPLHPPRDPPDHLRQRHPANASPRRSRSPTPTSAPPTTPTSPTYQTPENRALDRIAFPTDGRRRPPRRPASTPATVDFDALATERGLKPGDIDQGTVAADTLSPEARAAVFGATGPGIVGPVATPLGPVALPRQRHHGRQDHALRGGQGRARPDARRSSRQDSKSPRIRAAHRGPHRRRRHPRGDRLRDRDGARHARAQQRDQAAASPTTPSSATPPPRPPAGEETDLIELADGGLATLRVDKIDPPAVIPLDRDPRPGRRRLDRRPDRRGAAPSSPTATSASSRAASSSPTSPTRLDRPVHPRRPAHPRRGRPRRPARARRRRLRRRRRRRRHPPRRRRRDPGAADRHRALRPQGRRRTRAVLAQLEGQYREQVATTTLALYTAAAARPGRRHGEPGADRRDPRALPLSRMQLFPAIEDFAAGFAAGRNQVVWTRLSPTSTRRSR